MRAGNPALVIVNRRYDKQPACRCSATGRIRGTSTSGQLVGPHLRCSSASSASSAVDSPDSRNPHSCQAHIDSQPATRGLETRIGNPVPQESTFYASPSASKVHRKMPTTAALPGNKHPRLGNKVSASGKIVVSVARHMIDEYSSQRSSQRRRIVSASSRTEGWDSVFIARSAIKAAREKSS